MNKKLISIIVPIYNAEKYIERCVNSILSQSYKELEIILVNDGSTDKTKEICDKLADKDKRISVIHKRNEGVSKARNTGLDIVTGEYVLFADSDDWLEESMCEKMMNCALKNNSDIVVCEYNNYYENTRELEDVKLKDYDNISFSSVITNDNSKYGGFPWNKLIKREVIKHQFNENIHYYENLLFFLQNSKEDLKYSVVHESLYNYCINDNSAVHSKKYSIKKLSALEALKMVIPLVPSENEVLHKYVFVMSYYNNLYYIKKEHIEKTCIEKYKETVNKFYKEIKKSKELKINNKLKLFVLKNMYYIYFVFKSLKK